MSPSVVRPSSLSTDSRTVQPGAVFFDLTGMSADHWKQAVAKGAVTILSERGPPERWADDYPEVTWLRTNDVRGELANACRTFYRLATPPPQLFGVTGTNGKTTTTFLLEAIASSAGHKIGLMGTVLQRLQERTWPATHTTLPAIELSERVAEMRDLGADWIALEVSSHALDQKRADSLTFAVSGFTNLTPDHLDYHRDMESYFVAKSRLFVDLTQGASVVNTDTLYGRRLYDRVKTDRWSVGRQNADVWVKRAELDRNGIRADLVTPRGGLELRSKLVGDFNLDNLLLASAMGLAAGFNLESVVSGIEAMHRVPGRLEAIEGNEGRLAYVDYAHTPDALGRVLTTLRTLPHGRIVCVFGCGGNRDRKKRPMMGAVAAKLSDVVVVTSDNPRDESPRAIIDEILVVMQTVAPLPRLEVIEDRRAAIRWAVEQMGPKDILLVAGKGHETAQIIGSSRLEFDDRSEVLAAFASLVVGTNIAATPSAATKGSA